MNSAMIRELHVYGKIIISIILKIKKFKILVLELNYY